jgi:peptidyl-prolyl cis-trans isomerase-like 4
MAIAPSVDDGHNKVKGGCGSQFFVTLADGIDYLDGKHAVFGHVVEGLDTLDKLNDVFTDQEGRPFKDVRIRHVVVLDDPFPDPPGLVQPPSSPTRPPDNSTRIAEDEDPLATLPEEEEERLQRLRAAEASALTLEMVGDLPFANVRPPENVLFVCKLNPVTRDEDLELIFSRFGTIMSCQVIRDKKTGDSLQYAFIEFDKREDAEQAYFKMQNVLVDDRRIWVDFSQSVAKLNNSWSNNPAVGPRTARGGKGPRGGFAGREDLEQTRRYRDADEDRDRGYGMVFDVPDDDNGSSRRRKRSRSRSRERERHSDGDRDRRRRRSRSPPRDKERRRSRSVDRRPKDRERYDRYR